MSTLSIQNTFILMTDNSASWGVKFYLVSREIFMPNGLNTTKPLSLYLNEMEH